MHAATNTTIRSLCKCACHSARLANARAMEHRGAAPHTVEAHRFLARGFEGADVTDPLAAAESCGRCRRYHCEALRPSVIWAARAVGTAIVPVSHYTYPPRWIGDATSDQGEGPEAY